MYRRFVTKPRGVNWYWLHPNIALLLGSVLCKLSATTTTTFLLCRSFYQPPAITDVCPIPLTCLRKKTFCLSCVFELWKACCLTVILTGILIIRLDFFFFPLAVVVSSPASLFPNQQTTSRMRGGAALTALSPVVGTWWAEFVLYSTESWKFLMLKKFTS